MTWKQRLIRKSKIFFPVFFVWTLINLMTQSHVVWYRKHNLEWADEIYKIWNDELSEATTLQGNRPVTGQKIQADRQPERILLVSKVRSGSSFVGTIMRSRPATHYIFEPLFNARSIIKEKPEVARDILWSVFQCRDLEKHTSFLNQLNFFSRNSDLEAIVSEIQLAQDPTFLTAMCNRSPVLAAKTVRLRLRHAEALLEDEKLNIKVVFLVRDPRATINSGLNLGWCKEKSNCGNSSKLCSELVDDYYVARRLEKKYPQRFMELRYEDLLTRSESRKQLLSFFNTNNNFSSMHGQSQLTKWTRGTMGQNMDLLRHIQDDCAEAMNLWGYVPIQKLPTNLSCILKEFY